MADNKELKDGFIIKTFKNPWYFWGVVSGFLGAIALIQTQQYVAELTGEGLWWILGGVLVATSIGLILKAKSTSTGKGG